MIDHGVRWQGPPLFSPITIKEYFLTFSSWNLKQRTRQEEQYRSYEHLVNPQKDSERYCSSTKIPQRTIAGINNEQATISTENMHPFLFSPVFNHLPRLQLIPSPSLYHQQQIQPRNQILTPRYRSLTKYSPIP